MSGNASTWKKAGELGDESSASQSFPVYPKAFDQNQGPAAEESVTNSKERKAPSRSSGQRKFISFSLLSGKKRPTEACVDHVQSTGDEEKNEEGLPPCPGSKQPPP